MANVKQHSKFSTNRPRIGRDLRVYIFKMAAAAILNFIESWILGHSNFPMVSVYHQRNLTKYLHWRWIYGRKQKPVWLSTPFWISNDYCFGPQIGWPSYMANTKQHIKFGADRPRTLWDATACVFPRWWLSAILDLLFSSLRPPTTSPWRVVAMLYRGGGMVYAPVL